jgi:hypothetical protein
MKTTLLKRFTGFLAALVTAPAAFHSPADEETTTPRSENSQPPMRLKTKKAFIVANAWPFTMQAFNPATPY